MKCLPMWMVRCVLLALGAAVLTPSWAAQEVRVGAAHFPPYIVRPERGADTGLLPQLLTALNKLQSDYHFVIVPTSVARRVRDFNQGRVDMMLFENPEWGWRDVAYNRVDLGLEDAEVFVAIRQPGREQTYFDNLDGKRMALFTGYHYAFAGYNPSAKFLTNTFNATLTYSHRSNLQMVMRGRVDITLMTRSNLREILNSNPQFQSQVMVSERTDQTYHHYAFLQPQGPIRSEEFSRLMQILRDSGQLEAIFAPYHIEQVAALP